MAAAKGPCPAPKRREPNRKANIWIARVIPLLILALVGYACWVITHLICVNYLISPPSTQQRRPQRGAGIAIIVILYILLTLMALTYFVLIYTVTRKPGLVPRGPQFFVERARKREQEQGARSTRRTSRSRSRRRDQSREKSPKSHMRNSSGSTTAAEEKPVTNKRDLERAARDRPLTFDTELFWHRTIFACTPDGRPSFCSTCYAVKPDRAHHCSELNRCVTKMDHFCPWVSGVVGENSFKLFILFTFYATLFCIHALVVTSYYFAQRRSNDHGWLNGNWIAVIAAAGLFALFAGGMCMSSCHFALVNSSTIENLSRRRKVWFIAVYMPPRTVDEAQRKGIQLKTITYPRPPEEQIQILENSGATGINLSSVQAAGGPERIFAILETKPGSNPFHVGYLGNFQEVMGNTIWEWLSPFSPSPCIAHDNPRSLYRMGKVVEDAKRATGIEDWEDESTTHRRRSHRRSSRPRHRHTRHSRVQHEATDTDNRPSRSTESLTSQTPYDNR